MALSNPNAARSSSSTKTSITRTGLSSLMYSSRQAGNRVPWLRSWPWTNRFIAIPPVHVTPPDYQNLCFDTPSVSRRRSSPHGRSPALLFSPTLASAPFHFLLDQHVEDLAWDRLRRSGVDGAQAPGIELRLTIHREQAVGLLGGVGQLGVAKARECGGGE